MANPPFSGSVIILKENQDGIDARVYHWNDVPPGTPIPPSPSGLEHTMFAGSLAPTITVERMPATRAALKTAFGGFLDANYPDTSA